MNSLRSCWSQISPWRCAADGEMRRPRLPPRSSASPRSNWLARLCKPISLVTRAAPGLCWVGGHRHPASITAGEWDRGEGSSMTSITPSTIVCCDARYRARADLQSPSSATRSCSSGTARFRDLAAGLCRFDRAQDAGFQFRLSGIWALKVQMRAVRSSQRLFLTSQLLRT
jgi:hypothetical protein